MSARSCQLCGKSLSRLRVGGDGDFCSKEHRNQYGLRRGMDRLEEANKVTSLMRRRENPRQISPARLMCNTALATRGFLKSEVYPPRSEGMAFAPVFRIPEPPRLSTVAGQYVEPRAGRSPGVVESRGADTSRIADCRPWFGPSDPHTHSQGRNAGSAGSDCGTPLQGTGKGRRPPRFFNAPPNRDSHPHRP